MRTLSSLEATEEYKGTLNQNTGSVGKELGLWYNNLAELNAGQNVVRQVILDLAELTYLGQPAIEDSTRVLGRWLEWTNPSKLHMVKAVIRKLDTRTWSSNLCWGSTLSSTQRY